VSVWAGGVNDVVYSLSKDGKVGSAKSSAKRFFK
jgi:hypothetical protein